MSETPTGWYVVDHDNDDQALRGPYDHGETAVAVRREIERNPHEERNLWVVEL